MITCARRTTVVLLGILLLAAWAAPAVAQDAVESQSVALAKELAQLMDAKKLMTLAAKDGTDAESFVAAMYFAGSQLLVVRAKYEPAVLLNEKLAKKDYQEIYIDLNSAAKAGTRVFIEDLGADGLRATREEGKGFDSIEIGGKLTAFKDQKLPDDLVKVFAAADKTYARLLGLLIREAKK